MNLTRRRFISLVSIGSALLYARLAPEKLKAIPVTDPPRIESRELPRVLAQLLAAAQSADFFQRTDWNAIRSMSNNEIGDWIFSQRVIT